MGWSKTDGMNVLSLFDGMSCGQIALERAGIAVDNYFASEIDKYAIQITQKNYPNTIQLGDICELSTSDNSGIDLLIGGSPCQGFSFAGKHLNFEDPRSKLFFEFVRLKNEANPKHFLLENVRMKKEFQDIISETLGVEPIKINSALVSAQNRQRLYWTNIPNIMQPDDKNIFLIDIMEDGFTDREKSHCLDANYFKGGNLKSYFEKHRRQLIFSNEGLRHIGDADLKGNDSIKRVYHPEGKSPTLTTMGGGHREPKIIFLAGFRDGLRLKDGKFLSRNFREGSRIYSIKGKSAALTAQSKGGRGGYSGLYGDFKEGILKWRKLTPLECERLQTIPDNYTEGVSNTQRYKMIGNGWTVDVIAHILSFIKQ